MERQYNRIVEEGTTTHRNNRRKTEISCELFKEDLEKYSDRFDEETSELAQNIESEKFENMVICLDAIIKVQIFAHCFGGTVLQTCIWIISKVAYVFQEE